MGRVVDQGMKVVPTAVLDKRVILISDEQALGGIQLEQDQEDQDVAAVVVDDQALGGTLEALLVVVVVEEVN